ncbi:MAG TPA: hypothetical protein VL651_13480 [Bacteroidia bacterium]|jgi:hypothetical protein|nr:hypothetical protein [Bacteroidia bacterium]
MKKLFIILCCFIAATSYSQDRKSLLSAALKNSGSGDSTFFMRDSVLAHLYYDAESDSMLLAGLKDQPGITSADISSMMMQLKKYSAHCWTADSIPGATIISSALLPSAGMSTKKSTKSWKTYFTTHSKGFFEVSEPVFSTDGSYAIVYVSQQCGGNCGNGGATLYHWEKGMWKPVKNLFSFEKQPH